MARIGTAEIVIRADGSQFVNDVEKAGERGKSRLEKGFGGVTGTLKKVGGVAAKAVGGALVGGVAGVGALAAATITKGFGRLQAIDQAQAKMRGLGYEGKNLEGIMDSALGSVKGTAFGLGDAANAAANALNAGVEPGEQLDRTLKAVVGSAAASGASMVDLQGIFNKAATAGAANNEVLGMLQERGIPIVKQLAKDLGVSETEITNLGRKGEISFDQLIDSAGAASGSIAKEMGTTLTGRLSNAWAAIGRLGASLLGGEDGKGGIFAQLGPMIGSITDKIDTLGPVAERIGERVGAAFTKILEGGQGLYDLLVKGDFTASFRNAFNVEEDSQLVAFLFSVRDAVMAVVEFVRDTAVPAMQNFFEEFRNGEGAGGVFRDVLTGIWEALKSAFSYVTDTVIPAISDMVKWLRDNEVIVIAATAAIIGYKVAMLVMDGARKAVVAGLWLWQKAQAALNLVMKLNPIGLLVAAITALIAVVIYAYKENETFRRIVDKAWAAIKSAISSVVTWFKDTAWPWMRDTFSSLGTKMNDARDKVRSAWSSIKDGIRSAWDKIKGIFDKAKDGVSAVKDKFVSAKNGIRDAWATLGAAIARPINSVIDSVNSFLNRLQRGLNKIPGVNLTGNWGSIPNVSVPSSSSGGGRGAVAVQRLRDGGPVTGYSPSPTADNLWARVTAGEFMQPVKAVKKYGLAKMEAVRRGIARIEVPGYSRGGAVGGSAGGAVIDGSKDKFSDGQAMLKGIFENAKDWVGGLFTRLLPDFGGSWAGKAALGAAGSVKDALATWLKKKADEQSGGQSPVSGALMSWPYGWRNMFASGPDMHTGVDFRAPTGTAVKAFASGRVKVGGGWNYLGGRYVELAHPSGFNSGYFHLSKAIAKLGEQVVAGQKIGEVGNTGAGSLGPHLHFQLGRNGSVWNHLDPAPYLKGKALVADGGAVLAPGINVLNNKTGGPEPLMRTDKEIDLSPATIRALAASRPINVTISMRDLESMKTLEDFLEMINVRAGMVRAGG